MSSPQLSLVIASRNPKKLSEFYAFATNGDVTPGFNEDHYLVIHPCGLNLQVYRPSKRNLLREKGRALSLCLQQAPSSNPMSTISEWVTSLISRGAAVFEQPKLELFGAESWLIDPERNYFLIVVPRNE